MEFISGGDHGYGREVRGGCEGNFGGRGVSRVWTMRRLVMEEGMILMDRDRKTEERRYEHLTEQGGCKIGGIEFLDRMG